SLESSARASTKASWTTAQKIAFRFAFSYLALYLYPFSATLGWFWWFWVSWQSHTPWRQLVTWVAPPGMGAPIPSSASGDSTYDYMKVLCFIVIATLATVLWSVLDRRRREYSRLNQWLRWYVRVVLAYTMIGFGSIKIIPVQVP